VRRFKHNYPAAIDLVSSGKLDIRKVMTHSFSFEQSKDAFELVTEYADGVLKASIDY
jgi:threonine dehydrogenase-like Zn-dependent dehydrogenase